MNDIFIWFIKPKNEQGTIHRLRSLKNLNLDILSYAFNSCTLEAEAGEFLNFETAY